MKRSGRVLSTAALLIVACAALWAMQNTTPNYTRLLAPIETTGDLRSFVRGRSVALRVDGIELARKLHGKCLDGDRTFETSGIWVIVHASASATRKPEMLLAAAIETVDGTSYARSERPALCADLLHEENLQADVPVSGDLVFEMPAQALAGADLIAAAAMFGLAPLDSQLRVRLNLDAEAVSERLARIRDVYELPKR